MIAALSPADINYEETLSTLRWGLGGSGAAGTRPGARRERGGRDPARSSEAGSSEPGPGDRPGLRRTHCLPVWEREEDGPLTQGHLGLTQPARLFPQVCRPHQADPL